MRKNWPTAAQLAIPPMENDVFWRLNKPAAAGVEMGLCRIRQL
jgi:hypothetical protein